MINKKKDKTNSLYNVTKKLQKELYPGQEFRIAEISIRCQCNKRRIQDVVSIFRGLNRCIKHPTKKNFYVWEPFFDCCSFKNNELSNVTAFIIKEFFRDYKQFSWSSDEMFYYCQKREMINHKRRIFDILMVFEALNLVNRIYFGPKQIYYTWVNKEKEEDYDPFESIELPEIDFIFCLE